MTPSSRPLKNMDQTVPRPKRMPPAKAIKQTRQIVGHDEAAGNGLYADDGVSPHFVALDGWTMAGPSMWRMNCGRASVSTEPSSCARQQDDERKQNVANCRWTRAG